MPKLGLEHYSNFINSWNESISVEEVSQKVNRSRHACATLACKLRKMGGDLKKMPAQKIRPIKDRFLAMVKKTKGCWIWTGFKNPKGYGNIQKGRRGGRPLMAHRVAWEIYFGEIPEGMQVLHKCDNPSCVRPGHLFIGTAQDNTDDMINKGRAWWQNKHLFEGIHHRKKEQICFDWTPTPN